MWCYRSLFARGWQGNTAGKVEHRVVRSAHQDLRSRIPGKVCALARRNVFHIERDARLLLTRSNTIAKRCRAAVTIVGGDDLNFLCAAVPIPPSETEPSIAVTKRQPLPSSAFLAGIHHGVSFMGSKCEDVGPRSLQLSHRHLIRISPLPISSCADCPRCSLGHMFPRSERVYRKDTTT